MVNVRFTPNVRHSSVRVGRPKSANRRRSPRTWSICSKIAAAPSAEPAGVPEAVVGQATLGIGGEIRLDAIEEIHVDRIHMLDLNPTARLGLEQCGDLVERFWPRMNLVCSISGLVRHTIRCAKRNGKRGKVKPRSSEREQPSPRRSAPSARLKNAWAGTKKARPGHRPG